MNRIVSLAAVGLAALALSAAASHAAVFTPPTAVSGEIIAGDLGGPTGDNWSDLSIDRVTFTVAGPGTVNFDLLVWEPNDADLNGDGEITRKDSLIRLYAGATDDILVSNDDGVLGDDGSVSGLDSNLTFVFTTPGTYYLTIGELTYTVAEGTAGFAPTRVFPADPTYHFDWRLTIQSPDVGVFDITPSTLGNPAPVPEPASLALLGLGSLALLHRRARRR